MSVSLLEVGWIAGILEGEGCFRISNSGTPEVSFQSTDLDTIEKFRKITITKSKLTVRPKDKHKTVYSTRLFGNKAIEWMMTIYSLMGVRRREKIRSIIIKWNTPDYLHDVAASYYKKNINQMQEYEKEKRPKLNAVRAIMYSHRVSMEEAEKILNQLLNPEGTIQ